MTLLPPGTEYFDVHTHSDKVEDGVLSIFNVFSRNFRDLPQKRYLSVGFHPWHLSYENSDNLPEILGKSAVLPRVLAIGETGIDRVISTDIEKQEGIFIEHLDIASDFNKPVIIHCVRAYSDMIRIKSRYGNNPDWIIHGFNGKLNIAKELISNGMYISLGSGILKDPSKMANLSDFIPPERIFLETDEAKTSIKSLYRQLAEIYGMDIDRLKSIIKENFYKVFIK